MKRYIILILTAVLAVFSLSSCATMLPSRFQTFATNVEKYGDNYSMMKWDRKNHRFANMCTEYKDNFMIYTPSQRRSINNSIVTYVKAAAKTGVITASDLIGDAAQQITDFVDEMKDLFQALGITKPAGQK